MKKILLIVVFLLLAPTVSAQKFDSNISVYTIDIELPNIQTMVYKFKAEIFLTEPIERVDFSIGNLPYSYYPYDVEIVCNDIHLKQYYNGTGFGENKEIVLSTFYPNSSNRQSSSYLQKIEKVEIVKREWQGYKIDTQNDISKINIVYSALEPTDEFICKATITIRNAQDTNFIKYTGENYRIDFSQPINPFPTSKIETIYVSVKIPQEYKISRFDPQTGLQKNTSNLLQWEFTKFNLPSVAKISVVFEEEKPIEIRPKEEPSLLDRVVWIKTVAEAIWWVVVVLILIGWILLRFHKGKGIKETFEELIEDIKENILPSKKHK